MNSKTIFAKKPGLLRTLFFNTDELNRINWMGTTSQLWLHDM